MSIIPFDIAYDFGDVNRLARVSRLSRIYTIIRMTKMIRILRLGKVKNKSMRNFADALKFKNGTERLMHLIILFFVL